jgi:hypothetical protein
VFLTGVLGYYLLVELTIKMLHENPERLKDKKSKNTSSFALVFSRTIAYATSE